MSEVAKIEGRVRYSAFKKTIKMPCIDLGEDRDEYAWKTASHMPWLIHDDSDVGSMFRNMVEDDILYMYVRSICNCAESSNKLASDELASDYLASDDVITSGALCLQERFNFRSSFLQTL
ncbi:hypothetical protein MTR_8g464150 [Medicago truncatula]|uniref:Uncharacterized protein n=1 Tax=Medicago truncatula TaxID=3880 RepID=A0A072TQS6_MEDTR|nr:hypothetical protein MTR_8g464150 [Medicago truncatula]